MLNHLKNNYIIYLLLFLIIIVILSIKLIPKQKKVLLDTSMFNVLTVEETLNLFEKSYEKAQVLVIGRLDCSACIKFEPTLKIAQAQYHYNTNYLELSDIDDTKEDGKKLIEKLDYEYTYNGNKEKFSSLLGLTPMFIIIKNGKMVYGNLGVMTNEQIKKIVQTYDATYEE